MVLIFLQRHEGEDSDDGRFYPPEDDEDEDSDDGGFFDENGEWRQRHHDDHEKIPSLGESLGAVAHKLKTRIVNTLQASSQKALHEVKQIPVTTKANLTTKGLYQDDAGVGGTTWEEDFGDDRGRETSRTT